MARRAALVPLFALVLGSIGAVAWSTTASAGSKQLTFQIRDARAYAYKASIAQPVVQAAPKCDPKTDKYKCQDYNHKPNCPPKVAFGRKRQPPDPQPPENVDGVHGGAGEGAGNDPSGTGVPQSSAVRLNRLFADGGIGREGDVLNASGISSLQYVDLGTPPYNGNQNGHTETDAFTNQNNYEERCYPTTKDAKEGTNYAHFFSHSYKGPETVEYSECFEQQCQYSAGPLEPTTEHALTQVHLQQQGNVVRGVLSAMMEKLQFPGGFPLEIDQLRTFVKFESDGTASGLRWQVISTAQGVHFAGQPISLPQGQSVELGSGDQSIAFGMAGPYVATDKDGGLLNVVAPGLFVATPQQTAFFAGAEIVANFGRQQLPVFHTPSPPPPTTPAPPPSSAPPPPSSDGGLPPSVPSPPSAPPATNPPAQPLPPSAAQLSLLSRGDPPWAPVTILSLGLLGFLVVFLRWVQQFEWGRRMYEAQPMRAFGWLYRAFLKT